MTGEVQAPMRLLMQTSTDSSPDLLEPGFAQDRWSLSMHLANVLSDETRFVADSERTLSLVRSFVCPQLPPTGGLYYGTIYHRCEPPVIEESSNSTLYHPGDECYSVGGGYWVFIDPVPNPSLFPPKRLGLRWLAKFGVSIIVRVVGPYGAFFLAIMGTLCAFVLVVFGIVSGIIWLVK
jgi:hypothetical protein